MSKSLIQSGRPRLLVDFGLILDLRESEKLGWSRVATEYTKRTGQYISKQTCKRRYEEVKLSEATEERNHKYNRGGNYGKSIKYQIEGR